MMKRSLRSLAIFLSAFTCLCACSTAYSSSAAKDATPSDQPTPRSAKPPTPPAISGETVSIPGPLRSFMRMAAISQKVTPEDVLPLLSRNVFMQGYQRGTPTEFLLLLDRYVQQARELQILAGDANRIHVNNCDDAGTLIQ